MLGNMETGCDHIKKEMKLCDPEGKSVEENDDMLILKKQISSHALYSRLVETHLECLKLCLCNSDDVDGIHELESKMEDNQPPLSAVKQSELDHLMVVYLLALKKLKKVMEEPQLESMAFIDSMSCQLKELMETT